MTRPASVIMAQANEDAKVDVRQIKNNLLDIQKRRKDEIAEHTKQMAALEKEELAERKALIKAETKALKAKK